MQGIVRHAQTHVSRHQKSQTYYDQERYIYLTRGPQAKIYTPARHQDTTARYPEHHPTKQTPPTQHAILPRLNIPRPLHPTPHPYSSNPKRSSLLYLSPALHRPPPSRSDHCTSGMSVCIWRDVSAAVVEIWKCGMWYLSEL